MPIKKIGAFMKELRAEDGISPRALEFLILTNVRTKNVREATWQEIDLHRAEWRIPGGKMKNGKEHRVPLSGAAVALLRALCRIEGNHLVFPSPRGGVLSDMALNAVMRRMSAEGVPHGLRSTFRDWCSEYTSYPNEITEKAMAHVTKDKAEAAYFRSDLFEKRRRLMNEWAAFCAKPIAEADNVVALQAAD